ncbi:hypothetical protein AA11825_0373 [Acetobacter pomorum DSM 11825]|nr:hypothetical protein AA11825_0373 [Acetobacter pomorum DSM 11825]
MALCIRVNLQGFSQQISYPSAWVQAGVGILKNHLHTLAQGPQGALRQMGYIPTFKQNLSAGSRREFEQTPPKSGFSAPGFTYNPKDFSRHDGKGNTINGLELLSAW